MVLYFITGNKGKFDEVKAILPEIEQLDIDLPEIQDLNPHTIVKSKLQDALIVHTGEFIVEDTSLALDCLNGLPGPFIKWFLQTIGTEGLYQLAQKLGNTHAIATSVIGYAKSKDEIEFFEGEVHGDIVSPKGKNGFGWDKIFRPEGERLTFGEMTLNQKYEGKKNMRKKALEKLKRYLEKE